MYAVLKGSMNAIPKTYATMKYSQCSKVQQSLRQAFPEWMDAKWGFLIGLLCFECILMLYIIFGFFLSFWFCILIGILEYLITLNKFKSPVLDELHTRVLKELVEELSELLSIIFLKSWRMSEGPDIWRRVKAVPIFKRSKRRTWER